jgi:LmbE family N-acetylglucosaminyl deacetylase
MSRFIKNFVERHRKPSKRSHLQEIVSSQGVYSSVMFDKKVSCIRVMVLVASLAHVVSGASAQPVQVETERVELGVVLRQLNSVGTFMMATAHPDDENNALLALLAKGQGHRTVLVTATRGDGGQNEIGPELSDALAVLRTEELLAVHRLDGAEQFFTRAVDFGYSFSQQETFDRWGEEEILADFVRLIRTVRPDAVAGLNPEGQGGGQHHQASAILAREAYAAAADPNRFPEQLQNGLRSWQAKKFYYRTGFRSQVPPDATTINLAGYDTLLGRTYAEVGSHARSMHKCQGMNPLIRLPGQASASYRLVDTTISGQVDREELSLFDGIDTSIEGLARFAGSRSTTRLEAGLAEVAGFARQALATFESGDLHTARESAVAGLDAVRSVRSRLDAEGLTEDAKWEIDYRLAAKERQFERAVVLVHGIRLEALADDGIVTAGQPLTVTALVANRGDTPFVVMDIQLRGLDVSGSGSACGRSDVLAADVYSCIAELRVPTSALATSIHWAHVSGAARYVLDQDVPYGAPFRPTPFVASFELKFGSSLVTVERPIEYRYGDDIFAGEKRTELNVVPQLAVEVSPDIAIIPRGTGGSRVVRVTVSNGWPGSFEGDVRLELPVGWTAEPPTYGVRFSREDEAQTVRFTVTPPSQAEGAHVIRAMVQTSDGLFDTGYQVIEYSHIGRRHLVRSAESTIKLIDVDLPANLVVGYIEGVGDEVPPAIEQLGAVVEFVDADELAWGDLSRFDVIVAGVRAYERRPDLRANNDRLLQYVDRGGTFIVQYNKFEFNEAQYGPYAAQVSRERVTDADAPVRVLRTEHSVFGWPNLIGSTTWNDWVQERGLYFLGDKDPSYTDLIELEDTFEWNPGAKRGALVEARYGKGHWIYVGLGLWRQLPAGTTGAYQLLANLLSVGVAN